MTCPACGTENRPGRKFCSQCGRALARACAACGAPNEAEDRFCGECGSPLEVEGRDHLPVAPAPELPAAERRLVSVLFADLVGFTSFSESRDAEEVRDILSSYFDRMRAVVERHGGVVEKFIGDAVMAVWGTPTAHEDDAERAVRSGLAMVDAVSSMDEELGLGPGTLAVRVAVMTGEAAVTVGAEGQGMVAGDLVNTASRVQSAAQPGTVLVGEATRRATEAAIAYEPVEDRVLKGKSLPVPVWRALRVVAGRRGFGKSTGLEAPFVGRAEDLRLVRELFHSTEREGKARLVSMVGIAGIGKSRLSWEFEKYIDGLAETIWWHRGRCLAYGEGVTYWALGEMVRMRAGIAEEQDPDSARSRLKQSIETYVSDPGEQRWIEPRLAHLLGLEERTAADQADLFSGWRLFFERMAQIHPVVLAFEDLQWADAALLDFIEHLLDWSRTFPLFVLTLARPELLDRRPAWGAGRRSFTSIALEPLSTGAMEDLLRGLVPGLPDGLIGRIQDRAEGIPLYAVETVRMLLDRGIVTKEGDRYTLAGEIGVLEVPETLHALIAARLDDLPAGERQCLVDASVLGKTFTRQAISAITGVPQADLDPVLDSLLRKELLNLQSDPRSPERGQYGFLQSLVREVAYQTLSLKDRKARHLEVARHLESRAAEEEDIVEVVASHYLEAYLAGPQAPDAEEIKAQARAALVRAAERAASLAANIEARRYYEQAMELADDPVQRAELAESAGEMARATGETDTAVDRFEEAIRLFESRGRTHPAARVSARLAEILWDQGHIEQGLERMEASFAVLAGEEPDEDLATLAAQLARLHVFAGQLDLAAERVELALNIAEALSLPDVLSHALNNKQLILWARGRRQEAIALLRHALQVAVEADLPVAALRAYGNLAVRECGLDQFAEALEHAREGLAVARRRGDRFWEWFLLGDGEALALCEMGAWDEALDRLGQIPDPNEVVAARFAVGRSLHTQAHLLVNRGSVDRAQALLEVLRDMGQSAEVVERTVYAAAKAVLLASQGLNDEALEMSKEAMRGSDFPLKYGFPAATAAALELGKHEEAEALLDEVERLPPGQMTPSLQAQSTRFRARLASARGDHDVVEPGFKQAEGLFREVGTPFWLAVTLLEHGEWLLEQGRADDARPHLEEAREVFTGLGAQPWLERLARSAPVTVPAPPGHVPA
jgi:class 3 adenylate cyclase/tetratricopeptide (TPR) repeat protein